MQWGEYNFKELLSVTFTLFAVIDVVGSVPVLASLRAKMDGHIKSTQATLVSGGLMILFLFVGNGFLKILGLDVQSFAVAENLESGKNVPALQKKAAAAYNQVENQ